MRYFVLMALTLTFAACGPMQGTPGPAPQPETTTNPSLEIMEEDDSSVLSPDEEDAYFALSEFLGKAVTFRFAQTNWNECQHRPTGQYLGYRCASGRRISQILDGFMKQHMQTCVQQALRQQGGGQMRDFHIVHAGIFGDPNHSPRSLHAENRAIDIKSIQVRLTTGALRTYVFANRNDRPFYNAFRSCWGQVVSRENGCPLFNGSPTLTGSIGWEDRNHQNHMHVSVPYCLRGRYGDYYFRR